MFKMILSISLWQEILKQNYNLTRKVLVNLILGKTYNYFSKENKCIRKIDISSTFASFVCQKSEKRNKMDK